MIINNEVKEVILRGNKDECYEEQKEKMSTFQEVELKCEIAVKDKFEQYFHEDLDNKIDDAVEYIFS